MGLQPFAINLVPRLSCFAILNDWEGKNSEIHTI
jgi:hypothetical protein